MKYKTFTSKWTIGLALLLLAVLSSSLVYAQGGTINVDACLDQNADGDCDDAEDGAAPADVEACLNDDTNCQAVPATFSGLAAGNYTPFLRFVGASEGYYPTTPQTPIDLADGGTADVTLGAVYPIHPKGVAVHEGLNKAYVAFQGPTVISGTTVSKPYPFVAVIDGETDEVLQTIPGGTDDIGEGAWGVAVSGDNVYVGAFEGGRISVIDANSDTVTTNIEPTGDFKPVSPAVNPVTGWVEFPDYQGGRVIILSGTDIVAEPLVADEFGFGPFEAVVANTVGSYTFTSMRDTIFEDEFDPTPFKIRGFSGDGSGDIQQKELIVEGENPRHSGPPHALGLWQVEGKEPRLFVTYADDTRLNPDIIINPDKMVVYSFSTDNPIELLLRNQAIQVGDYAEVGLIYDETNDYMVGTYAGFAYDDTIENEAACDSTEYGGTYAINYDGGYLTEGADVPGEAWRLPNTVVGNPALSSDSLQWKNPFEIAINPNNDKVYVTDRCWNDFPEGGQAGGGAVLIFGGSQTDDGTPTPTPTATSTPITTTGQINLVMSGPSTVNPSETFSVDVIAESVPDPGLYGVQFEINFDPALLSMANLQVNSAFTFIVSQDADNTSGKITLVASQQGAVSGLTGDVTLLTFEAMAAVTNDTAILTFDNAKIGDSSAQAFDITTESYSVTIGDAATSTPTVTITPSVTLTPTATTTPIVTITPTATTPTATLTPSPTVTVTATSTATTATPSPTATATITTTATATITPSPTISTTPTVTITPSPTITTTPTATTTPTVTVTPSPTVTTTNATVSGQVILAAQADNDWSGATVNITDTAQSTTTDAEGNFTIAGVPAGTTSEISADAPNYLSAVCTSPMIAAPETVLNSVTLLSGDLNDDEIIDITDATTVGTDFGLTGSDLSSDLNGDEIIDIFDIILVSVNFGETGPQVWTCQ